MMFSQVISKEKEKKHNKIELPLPESTSKKFLKLVKENSRNNAEPTFYEAGLRFSYLGEVHQLNYSIFSRPSKQHGEKFEVVASYEVGVNPVLLTLYKDKATATVMAKSANKKLVKTKNKKQKNKYAHSQPHYEFNMIKAAKADYMQVREPVIIPDYQRIFIFLIFKKLKDTDFFYLWLDEELPALSWLMLLRSAMVSLVELHKLGIVHRDVKLENFIGDKKKLIAYLVDFEFAKWASEKEVKPLGSPEYLDPALLSYIEDWHQAHNKGKRVERQVITIKSDAFAMGVMLAEILLGYAPQYLHYDLDGSQACIRNKILNSKLSALTSNPLDLPGDVQQGLKELISHLLDPIPDSRWTLETFLPHFDKLLKPLIADLQSKSETQEEMSDSEKEQAKAAKREAITKEMNSVISGLFKPVTVPAKVSEGQTKEKEPGVFLKKR